MLLLAPFGRSAAMSETDEDKSVLVNQDAHPIKLAASCTSSALEITSWLNNTRQRRKLLYNSGFFRAFLTFKKGMKYYLKGSYL